MGEVYGGNDLKPGQPVALRFLSASVANNEQMLERFHSEVRIARQVSRANVCRVYDIGAHEGLPLITMEYVDGEDMASLLRRIGRLHRGLKPANVMIGGRGNVLITDFGLAGFAAQMVGGAIRNGTRTRHLLTSI